MLECRTWSVKVWEVVSIVATVCVPWLLLSTPSISQDSVAHQTQVQVHAFVDSYLAYSTAQTSEHTRTYTTQPLYVGSTSINLAMLSADVANENARGRLVLQQGSFVLANYTGSDNRFSMLQEANAGVHLGNNVWIDAGIFTSHIGYESIPSKDNWCYTRSIVADYTPYYETGVKLSSPIASNLYASLLLLNGWQNIVDNNADKSVGWQLQYKDSSNTILNWSTYFGNDQPDSMKRQYRIWNNFYTQFLVGSSTSLAFLADVGFQENVSEDNLSLVYSVGIQCRQELSNRVKIAARMEYYSDAKDIIVGTATPNGMQTLSSSMNLDYAVNANSLLRLEARYFSSKDAVYRTTSGASNNEFLVVGSLAVSL